MTASTAFSHPDDAAIGRLLTYDLEPLLNRWHAKQPWLDIDDLRSQAHETIARCLRRYDGRIPFWEYARRRIMGAWKDMARRRTRVYERRFALWLEIRTWDRHRPTSPPLPDFRLRQSLSELRPDFQCILIMMHVMGYKRGAVGKQLGLTAKSVSTYQWQAAKELRNRLREYRIKSAVP